MQCLLQHHSMMCALPISIYMPHPARDICHQACTNKPPVMVLQPGLVLGQTHGKQQPKAQLQQAAP
jgi:hypothetical protein